MITSFSRIKYLRDILRGRLSLSNDVYIDSSVTLDFRAERHRFPAGRLRIEAGVTLCRGVYLSMYGGIISIGKNTYIGPYTVIYGHGGVDIGSNVLIANHATIVSASHNYSDSTKLIKEQGEIYAPVVIQSDVWIGSGARILAGVSMGNGSVLGANSVLTKSLECNAVAYGVPARVQGFRGITSHDC